MIKEIRLYDWKSFESSTLYIDPLTILIGTNASGKSNVIDSLTFLNGIVSGRSLESLFNDEGVSEGIRGGSIYASKLGKDSFTIEVITEIDEKCDYKYSINISTSPTIEVVRESLSKISKSKRNEVKEVSLFNAFVDDKKSPTIQAYIKTDRGRTKRKDLKNTVSVLSQLKNADVVLEVKTAIEYISKLLEEIFVLDPVPTLMRDYKPLSNNLARNASNIAGVIAALPDERKILIEKQMTEYVKKLPEGEIIKVWAEKVGKFDKDAMLYCEEKWGIESESQDIDAKGMSDGTLRLLGILTALLTKPEGSLIVIEEVDNGLHPSRAKLLLEILVEIGQKRKIDILITTHNPALMDQLELNMLPFIQIAYRDVKTGFSQITLLEDLHNLNKLLAHGSIGELSTNGEIEKSLIVAGRDSRDQ